MYAQLQEEKICIIVVKPVTLSLILIAISFLMLVLLQFYEQKQEF